jgi:cysteinyl-tRNA synthetase
MDRRFVRYLLVTKHILKKAKFASDMLQKPTNDLSNAIDLIATLKEEVDACRSREKCQQFWDEAEDVADRLNLPDDVRPVRNRRQPAALQDFYVEANIEENLGQAGFDEFVRDVYEMVDKVNAELKRRFDEKNIVMMQGVTSLCPSSSSSLDDEYSLVAFAKLFNSLMPNAPECALRQVGNGQCARMRPDMTP